MARFTSLVLGKVYKKCPKIEDKYYFTKLTSEKVLSYINNLFGTRDKIITKFGQKKKRVSLFLAKYTKTVRKLRKSVILRNLLQRE